MRKLHLDNEIVQYQVGKTGTVVFRFESGKKIVTSIAAVKGISGAAAERGRWKRNSDGRITPSELKSHLIVLRGLEQARNGQLTNGPKMHG